MITIIAELIAIAIFIYYGCELFVNGIEWVGKKFNISKNAVGTVLAAVGTALPESVVTFIAVVFGANASQKDIGVGAAVGGPLILSTIAYAVVGWSLILFRRRAGKGLKLKINSAKLGRDQFWFLIIFAFNIFLGQVVFAGKRWTGLLFLIAYALYFYKEMRVVEAKEKLNLEPLKFRLRSAEPAKGWVLFQTFFALAVIFVSSEIFVSRLEVISGLLGIPPHIISLLLSPVATELPEILNAVIWIRQGKETLALGNVSGAMMIQTTVPSALGVLFTPWAFDVYLTMAAVVTVLSISFLWMILRRKQFSAGRLSLAAIFYGIFALGIMALGVTG